MSVSQSAGNTCLLSYAISTYPDPLQVSPLTGNPSIASLTIVVSNSTSDLIYCNSITFSLTLGNLAQNLTETAVGIQAAAQPSDQWQLTNNGDGTFTATPKQPQYNAISKTGLVFQIYNIQVNQTVGTVAFDVDELSSTDGTNFSDKYNEYQVAKFPYGFYVSNFTANTPMVQDLGTAVLTWIGSDLATYTILYDDQSVDVTEVRTWTTPPLSHVTNFILKATAQSEGETVYTYLNTTVTVANPDLSATSLTVSGNSTLGGPTTIGSSGAAANLTVNGTMTASNATVNGGLTVQGQTQLGAVNTGTLAAGSMTGSSLNVTGATNLAALALSGFLSTSSQIGVMGNAQSIGAGNYRPGTDGFVVGWIGNGGDPGNRSCGWIYGSSGGLSVSATGGNLVYWVDPGTFSTDYAWASHPGSFMLPVKAGNYFSVSSQMLNTNKQNPPVYFYWIPLGNGGATGLERVGDAEEPAQRQSAGLIRQHAPGHDPASRFVNLLDEALPAHLSGEKRSALIEALQALLQK